VHELELFFEAQANCEAVVFATNYLGVYGLEALQRLGRRIPAQLAVVAFDDSDLFRLHSPPITAVAQPLEALAASIIHTLLTALDRPVETDYRVQLQLAPQLIVRASSLRLEEDL
jgi:LacI family transcriptional regulator